MHLPFFRAVLIHYFLLKISSADHRDTHEISVIVDLYGRNIDAVMTLPISNTKECVRGLAHSSVLDISQIVTAPNRKQYYASLFSKIETKQDDGDVIWWISGHVSLLKLEKYVEDDNRQSVLQIDIVSSWKYCDYTSIASSEYSPTLLTT